MSSKYRPDLTNKISVPITGFEPTTVASENVAIPAGAAGTVVSFYISKKPILDSNDSWIAGLGDTSLELTSATFTNEVSPFTADADLANGDYWVDYITGLGRGKKANTATSMTVDYSVASALGAGGGGSFVNPMPNGTFLQTIDKDDNTINVAGYFGELLFIGDIQYGNQIAIGSAQIDGSVSDSGFSVLGNDGWSTAIRKDDVTDPENPVLIESYEEQGSFTGAESRYENGDESFFGFDYLYGNYSQVVSDNQIIQNFRYEGHNDGLSRVAFAEKVIEATLRELGNERGTTIERVVINGVMTDAIRIGDGGLITFKLLPQCDAQSVTGGVAHLAFETGVNSGAYAYQFVSGNTVPTDGTSGFTRGCQFTLLTGGDAEIYFNLGDSTSCKFKKVTTA
jgi:hypothetical protein